MPGRIAGGTGTRRARGVLGAALLVVGAMVWAGVAEGAHPGTNGPIAFESGRDGNLEIYAMAPDGSSQVNLTADSAADTDPTWSPDGTRIAFVKGSEGHLNIYVMDADGSDPSNLTPGAVTTGQANEGANPTWSPDGTRIAYSSSAGDIWSMAADGSGKANLTDTAPGDGVETQPAWSPDGTRIAYVRGADLWVMAADGSGQQPLTTTTGTGADEKAPDWSPDGSQLVYGRGSAVWVADSDGTDQHLVVAGAVLPAWSPDGTRIVFSSSSFGAANGPDIFTADPDGSDITRLATAANATDTDPSWGPGAGTSPTTSSPSSTTATSSPTSSSSSSSSTTSTSSATSTSTTAGAPSTTSTTGPTTTTTRRGTCGGRPVTIWGTPGNDFISLVGRFDPAGEVVHGLGGDDIIVGSGFGNTICGGDGRDHLEGRRGNDRIFGGAGDDDLLGDDQDDELHGEEGRDDCSGGGGDDVAFTCEWLTGVERGSPTTTARGGTASVGLSDSSVRPGDPVTVTVAGVAAGSTVRVELQSQPVLLGNLTAAAGSASGTFTVPVSTSPGLHHIVATATAPDGEVVTASAPLTVEGRGLPRTGTPVRSLVLWALLLLGVGLLVAGRATVAAGRPR